MSRKEFKSALEDEGFWIERTAHDSGDGTYKTLLNIEGLGLNLSFLSFFTNNPTSFLYIRGEVGNVVKKDKKDSNQPIIAKFFDKKVEIEELIDPYQGHCKVCGTNPCHFYGLNHYFCSKVCFNDYNGQKHT